MTRALLLAVLVAAPLSGCVSFEVGRVKRAVAHDVERQSDAQVGRGFGVVVGPGTIGTSRFLTRLFAPNATRPFRQLSGHVRRVKVGRYPLSGAFDPLALSRPSFLDRYAEKDRWYPLVTVRDTSAQVWILIREDRSGTAITDLLSITLADEDLVIAKVTGDLTALVMEAVEMGASMDVMGQTFGGPELLGIEPEDETDPDPDV